MSIFTCPKCGEVVDEYPALSRRDNKTDICSSCGRHEAVEDLILSNFIENNNISKDLNDFRDSLYDLLDECALKSEHYPTLVETIAKMLDRKNIQVEKIDSTTKLQIIVEGHVKAECIL